MEPHSSENADRRERTSHRATSMPLRNESETLQAHRDVLQPLLDDHRLARDALSAMERRVVEERLERPVRPGFWQDALAFFEGYFEQVHHRFEDDHVLPALEDVGFAPQGSATRIMKQEHERMGPFLQHLRVAIGRGDPYELRATVQSFVALHRQHLDREEHNVFPLLRATIARDEHCELAMRIEELEADTSGERHEAERLLEAMCRGAQSSNKD